MSRNDQVSLALSERGMFGAEATRGVESGAPKGSVFSVAFLLVGGGEYSDCKEENSF